MSTKMTKYDSLIAEAINIYKSLVPSANFVLVEQAVDSITYSYSSLMNTLYYGRKNSKFHLTSISPISSSIISVGINSYLGSKKQSNKLKKTVMTG